MFIVPPLKVKMAERPDVRSSLPIPMVYEETQPEPMRWEYHVLSIDMHERSLPDVSRLNELGLDGWVLVGILDERATGKGTFIYYYFLRQLRA